MKEKIGFAAFITGIIGAGFAVGGVETAQTLSEWVTVIGVAATSLMLAQLGVWMLKGEI
jgi:ABC-type Na+ efflux pump permease subunit